MPLLDEARRAYFGQDGPAGDNDLGDAERAWRWAMQPEGAHRKAKRFGALEHLAEKRRDATAGATRDKWGSRRAAYAKERDRFERAYQARQDLDLPERISFAELLYHYPGPHVHVAIADRDVLIRVCKVAQARGLRVGEFPPFDAVECVHVSGSWHYRDSSSPGTPRTCAARGDGLAADLNDADGGSDQEYAFYLDLRARAA